MEIIKGLCVAVGLVAALSCPVAALQNVTILGDLSAPPYMFVENGQSTGIYTTILEEAFTRISGYDVRMELVPWKRAMALLESGRALGAMGTYYRPVLRPWIAPYSESVMDEEVVVVCNESVLSVPRPDWPDDYHGLTVGNNRGFLSGGAAFFEAVRQGKIQMDEAKSTTANILKLGTERVDCYVNDRLAIFRTMQQLKEEGRYLPSMAKVKVGAVIRRESCHVGFSRNFTAPWKDDFIARFNEVIRKMKASGEIDRIVSSYH